jgi:hypothetical protein
LRRSNQYVSESVYDLDRWIDLLQLDLVDTDPGAIGIENVLHQFLHRLLRLLPRTGQERLDVRLPTMSRMVLSATPSR